MPLAGSLAKLLVRLQGKESTWLFASLPVCRHLSPLVASCVAPGAAAPTSTVANVVPGRLTFQNYYQKLWDAVGGENADRDNAWQVSSVLPGPPGGGRHCAQTSERAWHMLWQPACNLLCDSTPANQLVGHATHAPCIADPLAVAVGCRTQPGEFPWRLHWVARQYGALEVSAAYTIALANSSEVASACLHARPAHDTNHAARGVLLLQNDMRVLLNFFSKRLAGPLFPSLLQLARLTDGCHNSAAMHMLACSLGACSLPTATGTWLE